MTEKRTLTPAQFEVLWNDHNIPTKAIAAYLGVTRSAVSWRAHNAGLLSREKFRKTKVKKKDHGLFRHLWERGVSTAEIATHFGLKSPGCVSVLAGHLNLIRRVKGGTGGSGGWPKNTPIAVALADWLDADAKLLAAMQASPTTQRKTQPRAPRPRIESRHAA